MSANEQARADAMADAETLETLHDYDPVDVECAVETQLRMISRRETLPCCDLRDCFAWSSIMRLQLSLHGPASDLWHGAAVEAARAAFRAVPGLREE